MKVFELPYERVTIEYLTQEVQKIIHMIQGAETVEQVLKARNRYNTLS